MIYIYNILDYFQSELQLKNQRIFVLYMKMPMDSLCFLHITLHMELKDFLKVLLRKTYL